MKQNYYSLCTRPESIDDGLSAKSNYLDKMYPVELEMKDTTGSNVSASYLDLLGQLHIFMNPSKKPHYPHDQIWLNVNENF